MPMSVSLTLTSCRLCRAKVLMDELVRPEAPITDYVTRYSGITPAMMQGITTSLADVQVLTQLVLLSI